MRSKPLNILGNTIFKRLMIPVLLVLLVQGGVFIIAFLQGGVVQNAEENAFAILREQILNRQWYIENEMLSRWSNLSETEAAMRHAVRLATAQMTQEASDIATDSELNQRILEYAAPELVEMLRKTGATGAFLILDGPSFADIPAGEARAGLYIRDLDPLDTPMNNSDLLLERGSFDIGKQFGITTDTNWQLSFRLNGGVADDYFFKPLRAAKSGEYQSDSTADFGYWADAHRLSDRDIDVISYSLPLFMDGEVIGVLGIDISLLHLQSLLPYAELGTANTGIYMLGIMDEGGSSLRRVLFSGPMYSAYFGEAGTLLAENAGMPSRLRLTSMTDGQTVFYGDYEAFHLYNTNTPFENERWVILGMQRERDLLEPVIALRNLIYLTTGISLLLGIVGVLLASRLVTKPIRNLAMSLEQADPDQPIALNKIDISEIDLLTVSIENLSRAVAESASKMSTIMEMMNLPIGIFERNNITGRVFCTRKFLEFVDYPEHSSDTELSREQFDTLMRYLGENLADAEDGIYRLGGDISPAWLRLSRVEYKDLELGALIDVTKEMLEKQKIEYERDYDVLTDLYNRRAFQHNAGEILSDPARRKISALIMWDIDNLKYINDTYGHLVGDGYICAFAELLRGFDAQRSITARRSGDEFYAFLYGFDSREALEEEIRCVWQKLQSAKWGLPDGGYMRIRVSAGVAWHSQDAQTLDELIKYADFAMYDVKHTTKGHLKDFDMEVYQRNSVLVNGTEALNQLLEQRLLHYALQPIFQGSDGEIYGYEMLMRPDMRELPTVGEVLKLAEAQSKLGEVEEITLFHAMETFATFMEEGAIDENAKVFVNSLGGQMLSPALRDDFEEQYSDYLAHMVLELTEDQPTSADSVREKIDYARAWGAMIALDDYGTGYSNEASLIRFAPDIVKVDISIISHIDTDPDKQDVLLNLLNYARARGMIVLAEGVETEAELRKLMEYGVDLYQGYFLGRPERIPDAANYNQAGVALLQELAKARVT